VNPANGKAMNATKLKVKKISKQYESMIVEYKKVKDIIVVLCDVSWFLIDLILILAFYFYF
jgi:hypothetical protein